MFIATVGASTWLYSAIANARLPIDLEVAIEAGASLTAPQEWTMLLGKMGLATVRMRKIRPKDQPKVAAHQIGSAARYQVLAILSRQNELVLPKRRFLFRDQRALQDYFQQLPLETAHNQVPRGRFDLTEKQFRTVFASLAPSIDFPTQSRTGDELLARLEKTLVVPVIRLPPTREPLALPVKTELKGISIGTALAIALREHGLVLRPEQPRGKTLRLSIAVYERERDAWPTGWKSGKNIRLVAPQLFEKLTIEVNDYTFTQALDALETRIQLPVVFDQWMLRKRKLVPEQAIIQMDRRKTYLKGVLDHLASQARLATDFRVDEQGQPFLWITQFGKDSPSAAVSQ
ncbi:MAG: hypothetical protein MK171_01790 [Pirellulales bacterium]|nr:hypothetical protein [Pirellulales bacterium]